MSKLSEGINMARSEGVHKHGKCSLCAIGNRPRKDGKHHCYLNSGKTKTYDCGNEDACLLCHNAGMKYGDHCSGCGRVEMQVP